MWHSYQGFRPYVPVAQRRKKAEKAAARLQKAGTTLEPVRFQGQTIARSFWGKAWCANLESYSDYSNRLPRGRSYLRNGSVVHLSIGPGRINALVSGSSLYTITIGIKPLNAASWKALCRECTGEIGSLMDLLQGKLSDRIMAVMTRRESGLFPAPKEIDLGCSCPDWADMCKHVAAVLYGVGARLDSSPELLFKLRSVDHRELIVHAASAMGSTSNPSESDEVVIADADVSAIFGIEMDSGLPQPSTAPPPSPVKPRVSAPKKHRKSAAVASIPKEAEPIPPLTDDRVALRRKELKLSQAALGKVVGLTGTQISRIELGYRGLRSGEHRAIAEALGLP